MKVKEIRETGGMGGGAKQYRVIDLGPKGKPAPDQIVVDDTVVEVDWTEVKTDDAVIAVPAGG